MKKPNIIGLEYGWDWNIESADKRIDGRGSERNYDVFIGDDRVYQTGICTVWELNSTDETETKANAKAIKEVPNMINALLEARRVCKQAIELAPKPVIPDEHEYALGKIEQTLEDVGFEFEEKKKANKKAE